MFRVNHAGIEMKKMFVFVLLCAVHFLSMMC
jgi:hypothetical protein